MHACFPGRNAIAALLAIALFEGDLEKTPPKTPEDIKRITFYVMGANYSKATGNHWTTMEAWPTFKPTNYYMHSTGQLTKSPSTTEQGMRTFTYDPKNPVKTPWTWTCITLPMFCMG